MQEKDGVSIKLPSTISRNTYSSFRYTKAGSFSQKQGVIMRILMKVIPGQQKYRIALLFSTVLILTLLFNIGIVHSFEHRFLTNISKNLVDDKFRIVQKPMTEALLFDDIFTMHSLCKTLAENILFIRNVYVLDKRFAYITDAKVKRKFPYEFENINDDTSREIGDISLHLKVIKVDKNIVGYLVFEVGEIEIHQKVSQQIFKLAMINLAIMIVGIMLVIKLSSYLTRPIEQLTKNLDKFNIEHLSIDITLMTNASDEIRQLYNSLLSMSERLVDAMNDLYEKEKKLSRSEKLASIGTIAAGLAHELKNPIMSINLLTHKIEKECDNPELQKDINVILQETDRLVKRTNSFLAFAKPVEVKTEELFLHEIFEQLVDFVQNRYSKALSVELIGEKNQVLQVNKETLMHVFENLVNNSFEAGASWIRVDFTSSEKESVFRFEDNGKGFSDEEAEKAFLPFFTTKSEGTGLGLSICERMLDAINGSIQLDLLKKNGSCFLIRLKKEKNVENTHHR